LYLATHGGFCVRSYTQILLSPSINKVRLPMNLIMRTCTKENIIVRVRGRETRGNTDSVNECFKSPEVASHTKIALRAPEDADAMSCPSGENVTPKTCNKLVSTGKYLFYPNKNDTTYEITVSF
jgi:hypothetical protein